MPRVPLRRFTFAHNTVRKVWELTNDATNQVLHTFTTKQEGISGGTLERLLGSTGGSVKIKKKDSKYQEERTFPRGADPGKSRG